MDPQDDDVPRFAGAYRLRWFLAQALTSAAGTLKHEADHGATAYPTQAISEHEGGTCISAVHRSELGAEVSSRMPASWLALKKVIRELSETDALGLELARRIKETLHEARGLTNADEPTIERSVDRIASTLRNLASEVEEIAENMEAPASGPQEHLLRADIGSMGWSKPMAKVEAGRLLGGKGTDDNCRKHLDKLLADSGLVSKGKPRCKQRFCLAWVSSIEPKAVPAFRLST